MLISFLCNLAVVGRFLVGSLLHGQAMPEETIKTNQEILDRMVKILEQQKELIALFRQTCDKDYLTQYEVLASEFHRLRQSLKTPDLRRI
jgi:hypothetical protein